MKPHDEKNKPIPYYPENHRIKGFLAHEKNMDPILVILSFRGVKLGAVKEDNKERGFKRIVGNSFWGGKKMCETVILDPHQRAEVRSLT